MSSFLQVRIKFLEEQNRLLLHNNALERKENDLLRETVKLLEKALTSQQEKTQLQQEKLNKQQQEINILKEKLSLNSTNSSLPPSRDLYRKKRLNQVGSGRKPGGQPGHQGYTYQSMVADKIVLLKPEACNCGGSIELSDHFSAYQRVEIPPIKPYVTEYRRYHGRCQACNKKMVAGLPSLAGKDLLGAHAKAIICALNGFCQNSKRETQAILKDIFNMPISLGLISDTAKRTSKQLEGYYNNIQEQIRASEYLHIDETSHKSKSEKGWAWIFTSKEYSLLKLTCSRGKQVLEKVLGEYKGKVISDRYGAYNYFKPEKGQICWSHLARDFERFAHSLDSCLSVKGARMVEIAKEVFVINKAFRREQINESYFLRRISKLQKELAYLFKHILRIRGTPQACRVVKRMINSFAMMWRFVKDKTVEMTNNLAERQLRKYVIYRKKLLFTWSNWGNEFVERIQSLYLSCRLSQSNAFTHLLQCINNNSMAEA
jgi:transposase